GALVSEMSGLAGAGATYGIPVWVIMAMTVLGLSIMLATGSYRSVERVAIFLGLFELSFFIMAWNAPPGITEVVLGAGRMSVQDSDYLYLLAANLGTSVIPWTLLYQQSASVDKKLGDEHIKGARIETLASVVLCQFITSALLIACGATLGHGGEGGSLETVK